MVDTLFTLPAGVFLLLWGILWQPKPKRKDDDLAEFLDDDKESGEPRPLTQKEMRRYLILVSIRVAFLVIGVAGILTGLFDGIGTSNNIEVFGFFAVIYGGGFLILQRTVAEQRLIVLLIIGFVGFLVWRYAIFRDYRGENNWGLLVGLAINILIYLLIGHRFPPENRIDVITE